MASGQAARLLRATRQQRRISPAERRDALRVSLRYSSPSRFLTSARAGGPFTFAEHLHQGRLLSLYD